MTTEELEQKLEGQAESQFSKPKEIQGDNINDTLKYLFETQVSPKITV